jgi:hypothetical protein
MESRITRENFHKIWEQILIHVGDQFVTPPVVIKINGSVISTLGNFSASTGKGKSKKTFNVCAIVAAALTNLKILNYEPSFPEGKRKVLYFDTEQSAYHCHKVLKRINELSGFPPDEENERLEFVMLREYSPLDRRQIIELALSERPDVGLVIIDGLRDLLFDINSSTESAEVIGLLMKWTSQYNLHIHTVLHLNKGDDNVRGHIGTELNHKAETILQICRNENDDRISEVHAALIRDKEFTPFAFMINNKGLPEKVEGLDLRHRPKKGFNYRTLSEEKHREALDIVFGITEKNKTPIPIIKATELIERLMKAYKTVGYDRKKNCHYNLRQFLLNRKVIEQTELGFVYNRNFHLDEPDEK